ncbi:MAG: hypothetical protein ACJATV_001022 [Granulosicoccus sp.]|jgi:hypothetical protein
MQMILTVVVLVIEFVIEELQVINKKLYYKNRIHAVLLTLSQPASADKIYSINAGFATNGSSQGSQARTSSLHYQKKSHLA